MEWETIRTFASLARLGSASMAARELGVSHSTVARRIDALEGETGLRLFSRGANGYSLTADGERLAATALAMGELAQCLASRIQGLEEASRDRLVVSVPGNEIIALGEALVAYLQAEPNIEVEVISASLFSDLDKAEADLVLRMTNRPPEHWVGGRLLDIHYAPYAHRDCLPKSRRVSMAELDWLAWSIGSEGMDMAAWLQSAAPGVRVRARSNAIWVIRDLIRAGAGASFLPRHIGDALPELVPLDDLGLSFHMGFWWLTREDLRHSSKIKGFVNHLKASLLEAYPGYRLRG